MKSFPVGRYRRVGEAGQLHGKNTGLSLARHRLKPSPSQVTLGKFQATWAMLSSVRVAWRYLLYRVEGEEKWWQTWRMAAMARLPGAPRQKAGGLSLFWSPCPTPPWALPVGKAPGQSVRPAVRAVRIPSPCSATCAPPSGGLWSCTLCSLPTPLPLLSGASNRRFPAER